MDCVPFIYLFMGSDANVILSVYSLIAAPIVAQLSCYKWFFLSYETVACFGFY